MTKKVAYVVLKGREPGVYDTWAQTEKQVKGFSQAVFWGYTAADGGRDAAERIWEMHVRDMQAGNSGR